MPSVMFDEVSCANSAYVFKAIELHQDEVQYKQKCRNKTHNTKSNGEFLVIEALGPQVQTIPENLQNTTDTSDNQHLLEPLVDVLASLCGDIFVVLEVGITRLVFAFRKEVCKVREGHCLGNEQQVQDVVAEKVKVAS